MSANQQALAGQGTTTVDIGDNIANSLMLDSASSQYLSRTVTTSATWTLNVAVKRGKLSAAMGVLEGAGFLFNAGDTITAGALTTTALFRDPSAWMQVHISSSGLYINGTSYGAVTTGVLTDPDIGRNTTSYFDGYLSRLIFVDGTDVAYTEFGRVSADTGQWVNKTYSGSYGAKGFHLDFANSADLGNDVSGNNNDWTLNGGISSANQYADTPTNSYAVWNQLDGDNGTFLKSTITKGNLLATSPASNWYESQSTIAIPTTGKWAVKVTLVGTIAGGTYGGLGIAAFNDTGIGPGSIAWVTGVNFLDGQCYKNNASDGTATGAFADTNTCELLVDRDAGTCDWKKNGSVIKSQTGLTFTAGVTYVVRGCFYAYAVKADFGQAGYTPSGTYKTLCTANLPTPTTNPYSAYKARYESGTANAVGLGLASDRSGWTNWIEIWKRGDSAEYMRWRFSDDSSNALLFDGTAKTAWVAPSAGTYLGVALKADAANGIVTGTYSGNNTANRNISHSLGVAPVAAIVRSEGAANWYIWMSAFGGNTYSAGLGSANGSPAIGSAWGTGNWSSTQFMVSNGAENTNAAATTYRYILFADMPGFISQLAYTGNNSMDGTFIYQGGHPGLQFEIGNGTGTRMKCWLGLGYNENSKAFRTAYNDAFTAAANQEDSISNGTKIRQSIAGGHNQNASATQYAFAFLDASLKYSTSR